MQKLSRLLLWPIVAEFFFLLSPAGFIVGEAYPTLDRLGRIKSALLAIHGKGDKLVTFKHGKKMYNDYKRYKRFF